MATAHAALENMHEQLPEGAPERMQRAFNKAIGKVKGKMRKQEEQIARLEAECSVYRAIVSRCSRILGPEVMEHILEETEQHRG